MKRSSWHDTNADTTLLATACPPRRVERAVVLREQRPRIVEQNTPGFGKLDTARLAQEQLHIEFALERLDELAKRRLLHAQPFRGACDVLFLRYRDETSEMTKLHCHIQFHMDFAGSIE
jgi:hypothetical protein